MPISRVPGVGLDTGSSGVAPSNLSTGAPSWDGSGNLSFNSGYGSNGVAYGCRAWVNFNGTGTVAIRSSGNVSSITDNGTGDYTVNFTTAMSDANYCFSCSAYTYNAIYPRTVGVFSDNPASSSIRIKMAYSNLNGSTATNEDTPYFSVAIFR